MFYECDSALMPEEAAALFLQDSSLLNNALSDSDPSDE